MLSFRAEDECIILFFSNYYLECLKFRQISGIRPSSFKLQPFLSDQRNVVACNLVIEKSSFH